MNRPVLIVPFAAPQTELSYLIGGPGLIPPLVQALGGLDKHFFCRICVVLLEENVRRYPVTVSRLQEGFRLAEWPQVPEILQLPRATGSQPETIAEALRMLQITGPFWVKDPDNFFCSEVLPDNVVTAFPLDALTHVNPQNKSYLVISDADYVMNIAEKRIVGRYFCAGGYGFADAEKYLAVFDRLKHLGHLYLSHVIYRMLLEGEVFRPLYVSDYQDWGTAEDWQKTLG